MKVGFPVREPAFAVAIIVALASAQFCASAATVIPVGGLNIPRFDNVSALLSDSKVLIAGGWAAADPYGTPLSSAELYDPTSGQWSMTTSMHTNCVGATATTLWNGKVLVAGGKCGTLGDVTGHSELYDPITGTWTETGRMNDPRAFHTATLLQDGRVFVVAGRGTNKLIKTAEIYDPATGIWIQAGEAGLLLPVEYHTATLLLNGSVLVAGGITEGGWANGGTMLFSPTYVYPWGMSPWMPVGAGFHAATLLPNGRVLFVGGRDGVVLDSMSLSNCSLYNGSWSPTGSLNVKRGTPSATLLPNGTVLVAGGVSMLEVYDPATGVWTPTVSMTFTGGVRSTLLPNGAVLLVGQSNANLYVSSPTAADVTYARSVGNNLQIAITNLLSRGTGIPGAATAFSLTSLGPSVQGATIVTNGNSIEYTPANDENDSFTYTIGSSTGDSATGVIQVVALNPAAPTLPAGNLSMNGNTAMFRGLGIPGVPYVLQTAETLSGPWSPMQTNAAANDGSLLCLDTNATNTLKFYRLTRP